AHNLSTANFGAVLDADEDLSTTIAAIVYSCILSGANIEDALLNFVNDECTTFSLNSPLTSADCGLIKRQFNEHFVQIKESKDFDEFIVLDTTKKGPFFPYQNAISLHFADFARTGFPDLNSAFFLKVKADFESLEETIPPNNPWIHQEVELSIKELSNCIQNQEQLDILFKKLPEPLKQELKKFPIVHKLQAAKFLECVAKGQQNEAEDLLKIMSPSQLLLQTGSFTDYSGRTFNCTAYEYAFWAKDRHMLRMLEKYIVPDERLKKELLERCSEIDKQGLNYIQGGQNKNSKHFDFTPLQTALKTFVDGFDTWLFANNWAARAAAWRQVGLAQRDLPAHVIDEYCRLDRPFEPTPYFNESRLPRHTPFYNYMFDRKEFWFPLRVSESEGEEVNVAIYRIGGRGRGMDKWMAQGGKEGDVVAAHIDLAAVRRLDEVRTNDLKKSLETLKPSESNAQPRPVLAIISPVTKEPPYYFF
ncbi:MAG: hypothetical protein ACHP6H_06380, partial [Legionellales bacterium]